MDLKFKGKRWFSDKSPKWLESVFSEIDGFITRDKSEFAANQAPTVGDSVKTDFSVVMQDFPQYLEESGKFEAQAGSSKYNDIEETYFNSKLDIGEKPVAAAVNKSYAELDPLDQSNNTNEEFSVLAPDYCIGEADGDLPSGLEVDVCKDGESYGILDETIIAFAENYLKEQLADKSSDNVVKENNTNDKPGKLGAQVGLLEHNYSFETYFNSILSIGEKPLDTQVDKFPVELDLVDTSCNSHEELSEPCGNCIEGDGCLSSELETDVLIDSMSNAVLDEINIAKEEDLIDRKIYIVVEENYLKEELTHKSSDYLAEANDTNDKKFYRKFDIVEDYCPESLSWQEKLDQYFCETKDLLLSESTQEIIETSPEVPSADLLCHSQKSRLACNSELDMVNCVNDTQIDRSLPEENIISRPRHALERASGVPTASLICKSQDGKLACSRELNRFDSVAENKTIDIGLASSHGAALSTETSRVLELTPEDISNCENICSKPIHADRCSFEIPPQSSVSHSQKDKLACSSELNIVYGVCDTPALSPSEINLSGICVENKADDMGLASSNSTISTESCSVLEVSRGQEKICRSHVPAVRCASDLPYSVSSSHASQTSSVGNNFVDSTLSKSIMSMLSNGKSCKVGIEDPGMETIELFENSEKAKVDSSRVVVDSELLHAASFKTLRHKSYKKILQDAFASRKRLRKEYEQLAILYGDIDIEISPQPANDLLASAAISSIRSEKSFPGSSEPDWELL